ncbi:response regulator receiver sensor signal transduction histidine kinase [Candidatus Moduliflexus flocculans]|uniref:histidine kinase n=1 Tax=Candidatus Moduliflexus flocculans TaxID=1499966 RepID=A0A0S6W5F9_9BACT|nr:response regulator receiver sensor signal transduction histidine kinase [Candidatus Moduliflexus flocculans]
MKKILVIEDDQQVRHSIVELLTYEGYEVAQAENGRIGLLRVKESHPDLILCDIVMPELGGYGVLIELRHSSDTADIPFIFLSAKSTMNELRKGMELGADDYLTKPFEVDELLSAIQTRLLRYENSFRQAQALQHINRILPHELRTPLQGILSLSEFLRLYGVELVHEHNSEEIIRLATYINDDALRLEHLIENTMLHVELQQLEQNPELQRASIWCRNELVDTKTLLTFIASEKISNARRDHDIGQSFVEAEIWMNEESLGKIFSELLDNALKFSETGTPILVTSDINDTTFTLSVTNYGRGMTPEQIAAIGAFRQFDRARYEQQGIGLGLAIVQLLTKLHGGQSTIHSTPQDATTVIVTFPRHDDAAVPLN